MMPRRLRATVVEERHRRSRTTTARRAMRSGVGPVASSVEGGVRRDLTHTRAEPTPRDPRRFAVAREGAVQLSTSGRGRGCSRAVCAGRSIQWDGRLRADAGGNLLCASRRRARRVRKLVML
jgi:hypothetical protein